MIGGRGHARLRVVGGAAVMVAALTLAPRNVPTAELKHAPARVNY